MALQVLQLPAVEVVPHLEEGLLSINEEVIAEAARALNNFCQVAEVNTYASAVQLLCHACHVCPALSSAHSCGTAWHAECCCRACSSCWASLAWNSGYSSGKISCVTVAASWLLCGMCVQHCILARNLWLCPALHVLLQCLLDVAGMPGKSQL